jgi:hypothetical protein
MSSNFPIDSLLLELIELDGLKFTNSKNKIIKLKHSLFYVAPELIGVVLFNGFKSTEGLVSILSNSDHDEIHEEKIHAQFDKIVKAFTDWKNSRQDKVTE